MEDLAQEILRRANMRNISINALCKEVGVSRRWFEYFKRRIPKSIDVYVKIDKYLKNIETSSLDVNTKK